MRWPEYTCFTLTFVAGIFLFALPLNIVLTSTAIGIVVFPFYAVYAATQAKPGGEFNEKNIHQRIFRILQKCVFILIPAAGISAFLFGITK